MIAWPLPRAVWRCPSGKTRVARDLRDRLAAEGHNVVVLNDEALGVDKRTAYSGRPCMARHVVLAIGSLALRVGAVFERRLRAPRCR